MKFLIIPLLSALVLFVAFSPQDKELEESITRGKEVYADFCIACHLPNGEGVEGVFPPLANSDYLIEKREASIRSIRFGQSGEIQVNGVTYNNMMMDLGLEDQEVADVMNYIMNTWGNQDGQMVTVEEVSSVGAE